MSAANPVSLPTVQEELYKIAQDLLTVLRSLPDLPQNAIAGALTNTANGAFAFGKIVSNPTSN
jgi:hypothetical protein